MFHFNFTTLTPLWYNYPTMFEIPFNFILINPAVDIILVIFLSYIFIFELYKKLLISAPEKIIGIDLKVSIIFLLLGYLNYSENAIDFWNFSMEWWVYIIYLQSPHICIHIKSSDSLAFLWILTDDKAIFTPKKRGADFKPFLLILLSYLIGVLHILH